MIEPFEESDTAAVARRSGAAEMAGRISRRLVAEAERMEKECSHPPCVHAQGIRLAEDWANNEFCEYINDPRAGYGQSRKDAE